MLPLGRPLQARVETTTDVIPHGKRPSLPGTVLDSVPLDMNGNAQGLSLHFQGKHTSTQCG